MGQTSLWFRAFECDSSSLPACDGPNSSGLPTPGVVSPSSLLILGSCCTHTDRPANARRGEPHRWESKTLTRKILFLLWRRTFSARCQEWERFAVSFPVHQSLESAYDVGWCRAGSCAIPQCKLHEVNSLYISFLCITHKDKCSMCSERSEPAASGSLPQDRQKNTSRKRKGRDSCWGKMHQSAWLKAIISCRSVWNVEEWSLWRNWIVYLFMFVVLIFL